MNKQSLMSTGVPVVAGLNPALAPHIQATFVHNILKLYSRLEEVDTEIDAMVSFTVKQSLLFARK